jgi:type IV secretion system protein VirB8
MDPIPASEASRYFVEARAWTDDVVARERRVIRAQRWLLVIFGLLAILLAAALVLLIPLKRIEPYLVRVDSSTGIVDNVVRVDETRLSGDDAIRRYFVRRYVALRENYTRLQIEPAFREMALLTAPAERDALRKTFAFAAETSPYKRFGELGTREIVIKTSPPIAPNVIQVRFVATERLHGITRVSHHVATVEFEFQHVKDRESRVLDVNPLGFVVTRYRSDLEAVAPEERS